MWDAAFSPEKFEEAIAWFHGKAPLTREQWDALEERARRKAFTVAGVAQLDLVAETMRSLDEAIERGDTLAEWKESIGPYLVGAWAGSVDNPAWRLETIFRTNVQHAYAAGRFRQATDPDVAPVRPFWKFSAIMDGRTTPICQRLEDTIRPSTDPWWDGHHPPCHFNCRSTLITLTAKKAARLGGPTRAPVVETPEGFGTLPGSDEWDPEEGDYPAPAWEEYARKLTANDLSPLPAPDFSILPSPRPAPPAPPHPPAPPAPPPLTPAERILHQKTGDAQGSNRGGFYTGADGVARYVKFYDDPGQAWCEQIANKLYRDLGLGAPVSEVFEHEGRWVYASEIVEGGTTLGRMGLNPARAKDALKGFAADILVANWDAAGLSHDNMLVVGKKVFRIDNGGALLMRAKAGRKSAGVLAGIPEWEGFRDPDLNRAYLGLFKAAGVNASDEAAIVKLARPLVTKIKALQKGAGGWSAYVDQVAPGMSDSDRAAVVDMLTARTKLLAEKVKAPRRAKVKAADAVDVFSFDSEDGRKVRAFLDKARDDRDTRVRVWDAAIRAAGVSDSDRRQLRTQIDGWQGEFRLGPVHRENYTAFRRLRQGNTAGNELAGIMGRTIGTRRKRWELILREAGVSGRAPTHVATFRGVKGEIWAVDVARAWADEATESVLVRSHELASWSLDFNGAREFADQDSTAVVFGRDTAIEGESVYDQVADDAGFLTAFYTEHEVVAGDGTEAGFPSDKRRARVKWRGRWYTYAERAELLAALRSEGRL